MDKKRLSEIIRESINEVIDFGDSTSLRDKYNFGNVDKFTPYTQKEREQNFKGIGRMGNPSYDKFIEWRNQQMANGVPSREASYSAYRKQMGF